MKQSRGIKASFFITLCLFSFTPTLSFAETQANPANSQISPVITNQIFQAAKKNDNWKFAAVTGKNAQVVFMSVSPQTNPKNEIGMETHKFDQVIFIAEGNAKAVLNDKTSIVKSGDMIFIPQGTPHNVINLNSNKPLKIISVYSETDIPANSVYKTMSDTPPE